MHDREFEKQVQQKMQELRFQPGADVWARVQADVEKKRRRRPVLLWILFAGLMIGSAWILYSNLGNKQPQSAEKVHSSETNDNSSTSPSDDKSATQPGKETSEPDNVTDQSNPGRSDQPSATEVNKQSNNSSPTDANRRNSNTTPDKTNSNASNNGVPDKNVTPKKTSTPAEKRDVARIVKPGHQQATEKPAGHKQNGRQPVESAIAKNDPRVTTDKPKKDAASPDLAKSDKSKTDVTKTDIAKTDASKTDQSQNDPLKQDISKTDGSKNDASKSDVTKPDQSKSDLSKTDQPKADPTNTDQSIQKDDGKSPPPTQKSLAKSNKWQWGVSAGAGVSDLATKLFETTSVAAFYDNTSGGIISGPGTITVRRPSEISPGLSFNAGGYVSKNISKRLRVKVGLNYEYYSNNIKTGDFVDSNRSINQGAFMNIVDRYYQPGTTNSYTNDYHFVSLPLSLQWRVNKHPKYGVVWENGISLSQMLHSNALHFDGISGAYYKDNSLFQKTQVMLGSSLLFNLKMKKNRELFVGPHIQYSLTNMAKNDANNSKHIRYAGIKLMLGFNKN